MGDGPGVQQLQEKVGQSERGSCGRGKASSYPQDKHPASAGLEAFLSCRPPCCGPGGDPGRAVSVQSPVPPRQPWLSPSATICLPCASISRCYGNGGFQGNG